jgi:hypothetical protein
MDLAVICLEQALVDLDIANRRIIELTVRLASSSEELSRLRNRGQEPHLQMSLRSETAAVAKEVRPSEVASASFGRIKAWLLSKLPIKLKYHVDSINGAVPNETKFAVSRSETERLLISGWAVPSMSSVPFDTIQVSLVGAISRTTVTVRTDARVDVAARFNNPDFTASGFRAEIALGEIVSGIHRLELVGRTSLGLVERAWATDVIVT